MRYKTMAGFQKPYVPGWDCHGLPIEPKIMEQLGS
jgi:isoleucyl-tRNA synthetase